VGAFERTTQNNLSPILAELTTGFLSFKKTNKNIQKHFQKKKQPKKHLRGTWDERLFGGFCPLSEDLTKMNLQAMIYICFHICTKNYRTKNHTKNTRTSFHSCVFRPSLDFGRPKAEEIFRPFLTPFIFLSHLAFLPCLPWFKKNPVFLPVFVLKHGVGFL